MFTETGWCEVNLFARSGSHEPTLALRRAVGLRKRLCTIQPTNLARGSHNVQLLEIGRHSALRSKKFALFPKNLPRNFSPI